MPLVESISPFGEGDQGFGQASSMMGHSLQARQIGQSGALGFAGLGQRQQELGLQQQQQQFGQMQANRQYGLDRIGIGLQARSQQFQQQQQDFHQWQTQWEQAHMQKRAALQGGLMAAFHDASGQLDQAHAENIGQWQDKIAKQRADLGLHDDHMKAVQTVRLLRDGELSTSTTTPDGKPVDTMGGRLMRIADLMHEQREQMIKRMEGGISGMMETTKTFVDRTPPPAPGTKVPWAYDNGGANGWGAPDVVENPMKPKVDWDKATTTMADQMSTMIGRDGKGEVPTDLMKAWLHALVKLQTGEYSRDNPEDMKKVAAAQAALRAPVGANGEPMVNDETLGLMLSRISKAGQDGLRGAMAIGAGAASQPDAATGMIGGAQVAAGKQVNKGDMELYKHLGMLESTAHVVGEAGSRLGINGAKMSYVDTGEGTVRDVMAQTLAKVMHGELTSANPDEHNLEMLNNLDPKLKKMAIAELQNFFTRQQGWSATYGTKESELLPGGYDMAAEKQRSADMALEGDQLSHAMEADNLSREGAIKKAYADKLGGLTGEFVNGLGQLNASRPPGRAGRGGVPIQDPYVSEPIGVQDPFEMNPEIFGGGPGMLGGGRRK